MTVISVEAELYEHVDRYLMLNFSTVLAQKIGAHPPHVVSANVSTAAGDRDGSWSRPDLAALCITKGKFVPFVKAELHTFEVKTSKGLDIPSVHEASAHGRFGHFAWLVFQSVDRTARTTVLFDQVLASANMLGVGVITFRCPTNPDQWHVDAWPKRTTTDDLVADEFIAERVSKEKQERILRYLEGLKGA